MKKSFTFILAAALLASCQQEENETVTPANSRITISPVITRATEVNFETGDKIGVTITKEGDLAYAENRPMTYSDGVFAGDLRWYPEGNDKSQIVAYYPYKEGNTPVSFTVATDQTVGYGASDLMAAKKSDVIPTTNVISMNFKHILTKLVINVTKEIGADISSVALKGAIPNATIDWAALTATADASASATTIVAQPVKANETYRAIIVPQTVALTLEVTTSDGKVLSQKLTPATLVQGGQYSVNIRLLADDIEVRLSGEIENWTDEGEIGADNEIPFEEHLDQNYFLYDDVKYKTVTLSNGTTWMAEPLIYLPKGYTPSSDPTADSHIWYPYEIVDGTAQALTSETAIKESGYLYDVEVALGGKQITEENYASFEGAQGICPKGWHIPTRQEYFNLVGNSNKAEGESGQQYKTDALFYDQDYQAAKIQSLIDAGFNYPLSGVRMATNFSATPRYQAVITNSTNCSKEEWYNKCTITYYMTSTAYKVLKNEDAVTNIQYFTLMGAFAKSYPEGKSSLNYASIRCGQAIRCVKDQAN